MPLPPPSERVLARRRAIGEQIREARRAAHLTQEAVALRAGISLTVYGRIELARSAAVIDTLIRIADAIQVPLSDLVRDER
ncbi:helix-turn-helix domain-containing protein [Streptomyces sp. NPDC051569]|uniref:helix-turn-helix domain-containing protein n=1 Tax=Streptomyces sp. NPDC051569 TaxID=3365661 RepID=UPI0037A373B9